MKRPKRQRPRHQRPSQTEPAKPIGLTLGPRLRDKLSLENLETRWPNPDPLMNPIREHLAHSAAYQLIQRANHGVLISERNPPTAALAVLLLLGLSGGILTNDDLPIEPPEKDPAP
jgi:hypothetical protein